MRIALDTNVLAYLVGVDRHPNDATKIDDTRRLITKLRARATLIAPVQTLGELFVVLTRAGASREEARDTVLRVQGAFGAAPSASATLLSALDLASAHRLQLWDALILTAAAEAGCALLLSEDMQPGFAWRGAVVIDPFAQVTDSRLRSLVD